MRLSTELQLVIYHIHKMYNTYRLRIKLRLWDMFVTSLPYVYDVIAMHLYRPKELIRTFDAHYVNQSNLKKHSNRSNNRASAPTRVLGRVRNNSNVRWILRTRLSCVIWVDVSL